MILLENGLEEIGLTIFGTGKTTTLTINAEIDTILEENFLAWNDPLFDLKSEILTLGSCSNFYEVFTEKWMSWFEENESAAIRDERVGDVFMKKISNFGNLAPSQYLVTGFIFQFLVDMKNNENVDFALNEDVFQHIMDIREKISSSDFRIDPENVKESLMAFHISAIKEFSNENLSEELESLRKFQLKDSRLSEFAFKYKLIFELEPGLKCNESRRKRSSEDLLGFINALATADLVDFFDNENEAGIKSFLNELAQEK